MPTDIDSVKVGCATCSGIVNDGSTLTCTLNHLVQAGNFEPVVKNPLGQIPVASGFTKYSVALFVSSVTPASDLNPAGGDVLTIGGSGFTSVKTETSFNVQFDDGTVCEMITTSPTEITCLTQTFDPTVRRRELRDSDGRILQVTSERSLFITSETEVSTTVEVTLNDDPLRVESITPSSASPILVQTLQLQLSSSYTGDIDTDEFTVTLVPRDADSRSRSLKVVARSSADNTIDVKYGGAYSGIYDLEVSSASEGNFMTDGIEFTAKIEVSDFQPK